MSSLTSSATLSPATSHPDAPPPVRTIGSDTRTENQKADFHSAWVNAVAFQLELANAQQDSDIPTLSLRHP